MFERMPLKLRSCEDGQAATEYALMIAFLVVGLAISLGGLGGAMANFFDQIAAALDAVLP